MLHGQVRYGLPSRFLEEIPEQLVRSLASRVASPAPGSREPGVNYVTRNTPPSAPPPPRRLADVPFKIGSRVSHPRYGEGVVAGYQGQAPDMEIKVNFPKVGKRCSSWSMPSWRRCSAGRRASRNKEPGTPCSMPGLPALPAPVWFRCD